MSSTASSGPGGARPPADFDGTPAGPSVATSLVIDCDSCLARGPACSDCVVSCLLGPPPPQGRRLDDDEVQAIDALSASGLVPPLRLVTPVDGQVETGA
ncbi:MAG: hypothetical protein AVDCRST_MAG29-1094 [uncultured Nocardioidaceae bacterium]|uniref:Uncharacterized protein n=1 Tax=uncultured Nocardioidaceae bacterium TaxID=253824 RepID=A0A6J4LG34_9ACTN|nr:MAG: hypothetical protein AVDCRST_MAG29-1094 [uncultured Nocardioidaceae bacterium]